MAISVLLPWRRRDLKSERSLQLTKIVIVAIIVCSWIGVSSSYFITMAASADSNCTDSEQPKDFRYIHLWASADGETHIDVTKMHCFQYQAYSSLPQLVKSDFGGNLTKLTFTELAAGLEQPLHNPPSVQFVVTLHGSWYVKTTDGAKYEFKAGEILFQDNTANSPAAKSPQHYSGTVGDEPCRQMIVQINRPPEVDNPHPF